ncbi:HAD family hydrolase [Marinitoga litoralis]|jgi:putative hydrolase of the HAD superfamily|uniref:HAD family hydrolase n=1 Tax=Marinitoga litoralis TaxID=570855 RepID=UPI001960CBD6|nr:HAD family hydrolase [Marinitoga litoralis]MBM7559218.1 putative hydrolase of the HAD superfamily [Marinitoga litoralis]
MIKGVIFDLYGTLINANHLFLPIAKIISKETKYPARLLELKIRDTYNKYFKDYHLKPFKPEREYYKIMFKELKEFLGLKNSIDWYIDEMYKTFIDLKPYDDVDYLNNLKEKGLKIAILSNADDDFVVPSLEKNLFPYDILITSHSTKLYKPDPKIFEYTLNKMNLKKDDVIFVGDNYFVDVIGGNSFGIKSILIKRIFNKFEHPDTIYNLYELEKYI